MAEFVVTNPEGKEFVVNAPEGATQEQALEFAKSQFQSTTGGAATGNPNISRQGTTALKTPSFGEAASKIGGAGLLGGIFGAVGPELMTGIAGAAGAFPATAPLRGPLLFMGNAM